MSLLYFSLPDNLFRVLYLHKRHLKYICRCRLYIVRPSSRLRYPIRKPRFYPVRKYQTAESTRATKGMLETCYSRNDALWVVPHGQTMFKDQGNGSRREPMRAARSSANNE